MKNSALAIAALFAAANAAYAAAPSDIITMNAAGLEKAGFAVTAGQAGYTAPKPGAPQPAYQHPGNGHNNPWDNHNGYNGHNNPWDNHNGYNDHNNPWDNHNGYNDHNNPWPPVYPPYPPVYPPYPPVNPPYPPVNPPYPPVYPPPAQLQNFRFESGSFVFSSDAVRSMENAAASLRRAGYTVLEKRNNFTTYTIVFMAPSYLKVERYVSGNFVFQSEAQRAADEAVRAMEAQGKVILEKNVSGTSFTLSYLHSAWNDQGQTQTYTSGSYVFSSDAQRAMNETVAALQSINAVILEKRVTGTSYTIVFQARYRLETQNYASGSFVFSSDAQRALNEAVAALQSVRNIVVLERRVSGTSFNVVFLAPYKVEQQKYVSGHYTFSSDAQRAANETAAALASQGLVILEKNVSGTQFTITYFRPGYYY